MKIKRVLLDPDPRLRQKSEELKSFDGEAALNVRQMFKVMYRVAGVGLAASQVGWAVRLLVMNPDSKTNKPSAERVYWNPKITIRHGDPVVKREGCLSLPSVFGNIRRHEKITFEAETPHGHVEETVEGLAAQIVQHEIGHMDGRLCFDYWEKEATS